MKSVKMAAWALIIIFSSEIILPSMVFAGGPTQPEVQSFTPVDASDMVDPFTGNFSYNIPLIEVDGYPLNLVYNAGVTMDEDASWVGLGWNLNVGSINRVMRGYPDDFGSDSVKIVTNMKKNTTHSIDLGAGVEIFGFPIKQLTPSGKVNIGFDYNNYNGWSSSISLGAAFKIGLSNSSALNVGLSISGDSEEGGSFSPSVSYQKGLGRTNLSLGTSVGTSFNSRKGLKYISFENSISRQYLTVNQKTGKINSIGRGYGSQNAYEIGMPSFPVSAGNDYTAFSISGKFKIGIETFGTTVTCDVGTTFSSQWIKKEDREKQVKTYGILYLEKGQIDKYAQLDFARSKERTFTPGIPSLPEAYLTPDIFSINAQGIGGSYRIFRNDIGYVFEPFHKTTSNYIGTGFELGVGNTAKSGMDLSYNNTSSSTGGWTDKKNELIRQVYFQPNENKSFNASFMDADEVSVDDDPLFLSVLKPTNNALILEGKGEKNTKIKGIRNVSPNQSLLRSTDYKQNNLLEFLTNSEVKNNFGIEDKNAVLNSYAKGHHLAELTYLNADGSRYVFGLPAYQISQEEITFSTGYDIHGNRPGVTDNSDYNGLISYQNVNLLSDENNLGNDNYYQSTTTPPYAYAYMLTSFLSDDYIDSDNIKGPSRDDQGNYVKFEYQKINNFAWRNPPNEKTAYKNEGLKSLEKDDKASVIHGEKEVFYVKKIETKNHIVVFTLADRDDVVSANGRNGGLNTNKKLKRLVKISKYTRAEFESNPTPVPVQEVHFDYDYSLCKGYPYNANETALDNTSGKLTLNQVYFTYRNSKKMKHSGYKFYYDNNPNYNMKATDRWGTYKPNTGSGLTDPLSKHLPNADFPYTLQNATATNEYAAAWCLNRISLPSGGSIEVEYESDDYAFVQDRQAMNMFHIVATENSYDVNEFNNYKLAGLSNETNKNAAIYFKMVSGFNYMKDYLPEDKTIYYRCLMQFKGDANSNSMYDYDFVSGYAKYKDTSVVTVNGVKYGKITLQEESFSNNGNNADYNPIVKQAIQFARINLSKYIYDNNTPEPEENASESSIAAFANSFADAATALVKTFKNPIKDIYDKGRGVNLVTNKSWIRLKTPSKRKLGGGHRVKKILMKDNFSLMGGQDFTYGYEYIYNDKNGGSYGVASYEPQIGGDENPFRKPEFYYGKLKRSPDYEMYDDVPTMENQFPTPSVGYSKVIIRNLQRANVKRTATGHVVKEFYTYKDYPTINRKDNMSVSQKRVNLPLLPKVNFLAGAQSFYVERYNINGKPKREMIFGEFDKDDSPGTQTEYFYSTTNKVRTINELGEISEKEIGVRYESLADLIQSKTSSFSGAVGLNFDAFSFGPIFMLIPMLIPTFDKSDMTFKSATMSTLVEKFPILVKQTTKQDGAEVTAENKLWNYATGEILVTASNNHFKNNIYSFSQPAYWKYKQLSPAYKNYRYRLGVLGTDLDGSIYKYKTTHQFTEGDIVKANNGIYWVHDVKATSFKLINKAGETYVSISPFTIEVLRSGYRNKQTEKMASIAALSDLTGSVKNNTYSNVLQASAIEFSDNWRVNCNCPVNNGINNTMNPYVVGLRNKWRPSKTFSYLTNRVQSNILGNVNIRKDGVFESFSPFYKLNNKEWVKDQKNWTFASEITEFSANGNPLETQDALGRKAATIYSFNNVLPIAVASNTGLNQSFNLNLEDYFSTLSSQLHCSDKQVVIDGGSLEESDGHTGFKSLKVLSGNSVKINGADPCAEEPCVMSLTGRSWYYTLHNAVFPITWSHTVISGSVTSVVFNQSSESFTINTSGSGSLELTVTDSKGCTVTKIITIDNPN